MLRGDKSKYTMKQIRKARDIEQSYEKQGVVKAEAERRAWATVNKESGGGNLRGAGRGVKDTHISARRGGQIAARRRSSEERSAAAKKGWRTRRSQRRAYERETA